MCMCIVQSWADYELCLLCMWPNTQTARKKARQFEPRKNKTHTYSIWQTKLFLCHCSAKQSRDSFHSIGHVSRPRGLVPSSVLCPSNPALWWASTNINMEETRHSNQPWSVSVCWSLLCININTSSTLFPDKNLISYLYWKTGCFQ